MIDSYTEDLIKRKLTHEIHVSECRSFRGCRRRWAWVFRDNYYPTTTARPLEFGIAFHRGMEALFRPETWKFNHLVLGALAEKAFVDTCEEQRRAYLRARREFALEGDEAEDYDERIRLGRGMLKYFVENQLATIQKQYVPVAVEISFDVPLKGPDGAQLFCKCKACRLAFIRAGGGRWKGNPVVFSGRLDLVVHDMQGDYWLWDWKTAAQLSDQEMFLELDDQVARYCWAVRRGMGLNIRGFIYHEQRKAFPEPPKENKSRRLGRLFSVNANQATDYETYKQTVEEYDKQAFEEGLYDDFLNYLKASGTVYYRKFTIYKSDYELDQVEKNLIYEALDMIDPNLRVYPMPGKFACSNCAFQGPCISKNSGQDYKYTLDTLFVKQQPYYRRQQAATTEKRGD